MAVTQIDLDRQARAKAFAFGTTAASGQALVTVNNGTAAATNVVLDVKGSQNITGDLNLTGSLNITGSIDEQSVTNLAVKDKTITLNKGGASSSGGGAGIAVEEAGASVANVLYDSSLTSKFKAGAAGAEVELLNANSTVSGAKVSGNIGGNAANVTGTVAVSNGGTGATTLTGYVKGNGTSAMTASATVPGSDVSGNIAGSAANVTGTVAIANGGTGATTTQGAINATSPLTTLGDLPIHNGTNTTRLAGNTTATKQFLTQTGNGTVSAAPTWGAITAADVPTLNQNTTGTAANVTGTVALANGGTGQTTANGAFNALAPAQTGNSGKYLTTDGTNTSWATVSAAATFKRTTISGTQDGTNRTYTLGNSLLTNSEQIFQNGTLLNPGASNDYTISGTTLTINAGFTAFASTDSIQVFGTY